MDDRQLKREAAAFFDDFVEAFRSFDGAEIARRYATHYLARHDDGSTDCFGPRLTWFRTFNESCRPTTPTDAVPAGTATWRSRRLVGNALSERSRGTS
jgi:hypothetical protein